MHSVKRMKDENFTGQFDLVRGRRKKNKTTTAFYSSILFRQGEWNFFRLLSSVPQRKIIISHRNPFKFSPFL